MKENWINKLGNIILILAGVSILVHLIYGAFFNPYRMNMFMSENKQDRYDWMLNENIQETTNLVYSIGRKNDKFLYVYNVSNKYLVYINEIKEYNKVELDSIEFVESTSIKNFFTSSSGGYGNPSLTFEIKPTSIKTRKLKLSFSKNTQIIEVNRTKEIIQAKLKLNSMMICDNMDNMHYKIQYEDHCIPIDLCVYKTNDSFFIVYIRSIDNKINDRNIARRLLNLNTSG